MLLTAWCQQLLLPIVGSKSHGAKACLPPPSIIHSSESRQRPPHQRQRRRRRAATATAAAAAAEQRSTPLTHSNQCSRQRRRRRRLAAVRAHCSFSLDAFLRRLAKETDSCELRPVTRCSRRLHHWKNGALPPVARRNLCRVSVCGTADRVERRPFLCSACVSVGR